MNEDNNCAVVVNSCDKTFYTEPGWNWFFQKNWNKDCAWPVYFVTETRDIDFDGVYNIKTGKCSWYEYLHKVFEKVDQEYVLFAMDDHFFLKPIDSLVLYSVLEFVRKYKWMRFGLYKKIFRAQEPTLRRDSIAGYEHRQLTRGSGYLSSLQPSIWNTEFMLKVMEPSWMPWDGEIKGTQKIRKIFSDPLVSSFNLPISYISLSGWYREAYKQGEPRTVDGDYAALKSIYNWTKDNG